MVGTPIGNLEDLSARAVRILGEVSAIAAEDTRVTSRLLARHGIRKPMLSYRAPVERRGLPRVVAALEEGDVALVSDAGTPTLSGVTFVGYLPRKPGEMRRLLESLRADPRPAVAFESPFRIRKSLALIAESLPERRLTVTRELTKVHEEVLRGTASNVLEALGDRARGEFTLVFAGA